ncbi:hypothetical protein, variant 1 [Aphanomyces invadans]|uniref:Amidohydrolase 3 domain-containing protein n=1 Tax=Aphanomyces invadans TaxID=157072 RepID=A0A024TKI1_9STRA|nr:hypothetical protein, variant 1 [Aphanomyces invadans]ETV94660.1 hypothetical protein, variant 1 [Aphanomyces invadans]|eukprot:XP_008876604.1 hypothetical protein, variant 1 [Aphanomyces invadans]
MGSVPNIPMTEVGRRATTTLYENGRVWQWTPRAPGGKPSDPRDFAGYASWFTTSGSTISVVGHGEVPQEVRANASTVVDLQGQVVLPGLHDSHIHLYHMGEVAHYVDLRGTSSFADLAARVVAHASKFPLADWLVGFGWEQDKLSVPARYPTRADLDAIPVNRPIYLWRACFHIAVVNSKALDVAGLDTSPHPTWAQCGGGGVVDLDCEGIPTGILRESAVNLVQRCILETSDAVRTQYLQLGLQTCLEFGLTGVQTNDAHCLPLYHALQASNQLPLRVYMTPDHNEIDPHHHGCLDVGGPFQHDLITVDRVKLFADGSLGAETAALRQPYRDSTNQGILVHTNDDMVAKIRIAHDAGYRVEIHAIGDRAAAQVLAAMAQVPGIDRPLLTHCQILGPDLLETMAALGVVANIQPSFVVTDATFASKRLPPSLLPYSYCWQKMIDAGIVCAGGSDAPIETSNPFQGMYDAMHRTAPLDDPLECLSFPHALQLYTLNSALIRDMDAQTVALHRARF